MPRAIEGFAALCERAAKRGVRVVLEGIPSFMPVDLAMAWSIVRQSGAANAGIDVDMMHWHYQRGGPDFELLRSIPGERIYYSQICDAALAEAPSDEDYIRVAVSERPLPGDGVVDIRAVLKTLDDIGARPLYAMEVYNAELRRKGPEAMAKKVHEAADRLFARA
jgi:sugar phosphate isomerase/epimerase